MPNPAPQFQLSPDDEKGPWRAELLAAAADALGIAERRLGLTLDAPPRLMSLAPPDAFYKYLGMKPHNYMAVAEASSNEVIINRSEFLSTGAGGRRAVLVHEFSHLIIGRRVPGGVPRWLDEGIAMITAGEHTFEHYTRLVTAASFGHLIPMDQLWQSGLEGQDLAYAQSLSVTRHLIRERGGDPSDPGPLARKLASPDRGENLRALLRDPIYMRAFEREWRRSLRDVWTWVGALAGGGVLWIFLAGLMMLAYWRKRRMGALKVKEWEREAYLLGYDEAAEERLDEYLWDEDEGNPPGY